MIEFETRGRYSNDEAALGIRIGNIFCGTEEYLELSGGTWKVFRDREKRTIHWVRRIRTKTN